MMYYRIYYDDGGHSPSLVLCDDCVAKHEAHGHDVDPYEELNGDHAICDNCGKSEVTDEFELHQAA